MNDENISFLNDLNEISKKIHALRTLGIQGLLLEDKYEEAYSKHLQGETDDARLLCEELSFLFSLIEDFISRQINNIENYEKKDRDLTKKASADRLEPEEKLSKTREKELKSLCENIFSHPYFREQALIHLEHFLIEEFNQNLPILKDSLIKTVQKYLEEEKVNIKSQLYNTLRYDLLQYLEHKKITPRK